MKRLPSKILSLLLSLTLLFGVCTIPTYAADNSYTDTHGHWAESSIQRWSDYDIVQGNNGEFSPDAPLTRAQMAAILSRLLTLPEAGSAGFTDVAENAWYAGGIDRCFAAGILQGSDGKAMPDAPITREQAVTMLCRALNIEAVKNADLSDYADGSMVSGYAVGYLAAMIQNGMVKGTDDITLSPTASITRASVVTILDRAIAVYANKDGETIDAPKVDGLILIAAKNVTVKNAPKGTSILVCKNASGATVNGKAVDAGISSVAEEVQPAKPTTGGGSSGGSSGGGGTAPSYSDLTIAEAKTVSSGTYQNITITDAVGDGEVTLSGLTIRGDLTIKGGGSNSVKLENCTVGGKVIMDKAAGQPPRLHLTNTPVKAVEVKQPAILESADTASGIAAVTVLSDTTVQGTNTKIDKMNVPESAAQPVNLIVNDAEVSQINTNKETSISGNGSGKVDTVVAGAPVNVDSATVDQVEVPANAENVVVNVTGGYDIVIKADSDSTKIAADNTDNITVDGDAKGSITPHAHIWNAGVVTKQPSCSEEGVRTYTCAAANCPSNTKTESIAKTAHTEVIDAAIPADCIAAGKTEGKHCSVCDAVLVAQEETKALGHDFTGNYSSDANGHWHKCSRCDVTEEKAAHTYPENTDCTQEVNCTVCGYTKPAGEHIWNAGEITTAATCTVNGVRTYTCTVCVQTKTEAILAPGHVETTIPAQAATCTETGLTAGKKCSVCGEVLVEQQEVPATGHNPDSIWTFGAIPDMHYKKCLTCGEIAVTAEHTWDNGVVTVEPTETEDGEKTYTCTVCGDTKTEYISKSDVVLPVPTGFSFGIDKEYQAEMVITLDITVDDEVASSLSRYGVNFSFSADGGNTWSVNVGQFHPKSTYGKIDVFSFWMLDSGTYNKIKMESFAIVDHVMITDEVVFDCNVTVTKEQSQATAAITEKDDGNCDITISGLTVAGDMESCCDITISETEGFDKWFRGMTGTIEGTDGTKTAGYNKNDDERFSADFYYCISEYDYDDLVAEETTASASYKRTNWVKANIVKGTEG